MHRSNHAPGELLRLAPILIATALMAVATAGTTPDLQDGDIVLHKSRSSQSAALRHATGSPYTHVGLFFEHEGKPMVLEAVQPVRWTPLDEWTARGEQGHIAVLRPKNRLDDKTIATVRDRASSFLGRPYDLQFDWDDHRIYCSELVYKAYDAVGLELGELAPMRSFDLSHPAVQSLMRSRNAHDLDRTMVSPVSILEDDDLTVVYTNDPAL